MSDTGGESFLSRWSRRKRSGTAPSLRDRLGQSSGIPGRDNTADKAALQHTTDPSDAHLSDMPDETGQGLKVAHSNGLQDCQTGDNTEPPEQGSPHDASAPQPAEEAAPAPGNTFDDVDFGKLDFNSDYTRFMDHDVPDDVRNSALRKLWVSNPVLANMDGLDDYCEDYTDAAVCLPKGLMKTAYQYGRGFLDDSEVAAWEKLGTPAEGSGEAEQSQAAQEAGQEPAEYSAPGDKLVAEQSGPPGSSSVAQDVTTQDINEEADVTGAKSVTDLGDQSSMPRGSTGPA